MCAFVESHCDFFCFFFFFFSSRRRHTRLQGDWSSDVCSSDLELGDEEDDDGGRGHPPERDPGARLRNGTGVGAGHVRSEEHTSELQSPCNLVCRLLLEKKKKNIQAQRSEERVARKITQLRIWA